MMRQTMRQSMRQTLGVLSLAMGFSTTVVAQTPVAGAGAAFPVKPIELIVHTGPGGGSDIFTRVVADIIAKDKLLPVTTIIQNKAGGGGALAQNYVVGKRGDPYTVYAMVASLMVAIPIRSGTDTGLDKFVPLALMGFDINCIAVRADSPYKTVKDLVDAARANPKAVTISMGSVGSASHYLPFQLEKMTGVKFNLVSMKSGAEAVTTMLGGHVQATTEQLAEMTQYIEAGKIRVLAVASGKRLPGAPDIPTLKEQGYALHVGAGRGFMAPAGVPREAAATLESAFEKAYKTPAWRDYMRRNFYEDVYMSGAELGRHMTEIKPDMERFIRELGLANKP
jgi:putative tricarboxylic transport membrane protein